MRLYTFINFYLSQIQQGIQTAHILGDLCIKKLPMNQTKMLYDYLENHKTIIVCNGGNSASIWELCQFFKNERNPYPFSYFCEDGDSLGGALTGVGIVLPEEIYGAVKVDSTYPPAYYYEYAAGSPDVKRYYEDCGNCYEYELINRIKSFRLA
jgi:hypothetical protein